MIYFHHHSPENTGRSSEKSVGTFTWDMQPARRSRPILTGNRSLPGSRHSLPLVGGIVVHPGVR